jgi:hypothetical protein
MNEKQKYEWGLCRDYVGIVIFFVEKIKNEWKNKKWMKNSIMTFSLKEIAPTFGYVVIS